MKKINANDLLQYFPKVELPVTITEESRMTFSKENKPLPPDLIAYISEQFEQELVDEFTEFIPGFRIDSDEFKLMLYWKGKLMHYEYILVSLDKKGQLLSRKVIAGTKWKDNIVTQSVAKIDEDLIIHIIVGASNGQRGYNPENSRAMSMEVLSTGDIIFSLDNADLN